MTAGVILLALYAFCQLFMCSCSTLHKKAAKRPIYTITHGVYKISFSCDSSSHGKFEAIYKKIAKCLGTRKDNNTVVIGLDIKTLGDYWDTLKVRYIQYKGQVYPVGAQLQKNKNTNCKIIREFLIHQLQSVFKRHQLKEAEIERKKIKDNKKSRPIKADFFNI